MVIWQLEQYPYDLPPANSTAKKTRPADILKTQKKKRNKQKNNNNDAKKKGQPSLIYT